MAPISRNNICVENSTNCKSLYLKMPYWYFQFIHPKNIRVFPTSVSWSFQTHSVRLHLIQFHDDTNLRWTFKDSFFLQNQEMRGNPPPLLLRSMPHPRLPVLLTRHSVWAIFTTLSVGAELTIPRCYASPKLYSKFCRDGSNISTCMYKCPINGF